MQEEARTDTVRSTRAVLPTEEDKRKATTMTARNLKRNKDRAYIEGYRKLRIIEDSKDVGTAVVAP